MARDPVTDGTASLGPAAADLLDAYVSAIAARLPGPRRARATAIAELRDGLHDALDAHPGRRHDAVAAAEQVIAESGSVAVVADAYTLVLTDRQARHTGQALIATGPLVGLLWLFTLVPRQGPGALLVAMPPLGAVVTVGVLAGLVALATTGRAARWFPEIRRLPQRAAVAACIAAGSVDLAVLSIAAARVLTNAGTLPWAIALFAVAASITRLVFSQHAARIHLQPRTSAH